MELEDEFKIKIDDQDAESFVTVKDVVRYIENLFNLTYVKLSRTVMIIKFAKIILKKIDFMKSKC